MAGAATFIALACIAAADPANMANAGMDRGELVIATALAAISGSVPMGLCRAGSKGGTAWLQYGRRDGSPAASSPPRKR